MTKPFVVFLNGPPGSGKDFAAEVLSNADDITVSHYKFAEPLKDAACALLEIDSRTLEISKNQVVGLYGVTIRQILIDISEKWMKPCYGKDIFGKIAAERVSEEMQGNDYLGEEQPDIFVFSDCGFGAEVHHVIDLFGKENSLLVRIRRDGCTYEGDSRSYIELSDVDTIDISNMGDETFGVSLLKFVNAWLKGKKNGN